MVSKLLPCGPLLMVRVWGGAELTKCSAAQTMTAHTSTAGPTVWAKAQKETLPFLDGSNQESLPFDSVMFVRSEVVPRHHARPRSRFPASGAGSRQRG